jgi:DNA-binding PadR family transcriptional regulator
VFKIKKSNSLKVFSGKEASLNYAIFLVLLKDPLIPYDVWLSVRSIKDFRHEHYRTVCRRIHAIYEQGYLIVVGRRDTKPAGNSPLYTLTLKAKAALKLNKQSIDDYLQTATDKQLQKLIEALQ